MAEVITLNDSYSDQEPLEVNELNRACPSTQGIDGGFRGPCEGQSAQTGSTSDGHQHRRTTSPIVISDSDDEDNSRHRNKMSCKRDRFSDVSRARLETRKTQRATPVDVVEVSLQESVVKTANGLTLFGLLLRSDEVPISISKVPMAGTMSWRRARVPDIVAAALFFSALEFTERIRSYNLAPRARSLTSAYPSMPLYVIIVGAREFCRKQARKHMSASTVEGVVVAETAVPDACSFLYLELGLRAISFDDIGAAAMFIARIPSAASELARTREFDSLALRAAYEYRKTGPSA